MRISSFLLGGAVGASVVWMLNNRKHPMVSMMKLVASDKMTNKNEKSSYQSTAPSHTTDQMRAENTSLIRSIIDEDPQLKQEFNSITEQASTADLKDESVVSSSHQSH